MKQTNLQTFGKPPLPRGYSPSHILTYRRCEYKFLLAFIYKVKVETKFQPLLTGSSIHEDISKGIFTSEAPERQKMLNVAQEFLSEMPANPMFETTYEDPNNPGIFRGMIFGKPFIGIFDDHWVEERQGVDWKASKHNEKYDSDYEIQAYILNELFKQKYKHNLRKFTFVFLKDGFRYEAQSIYNGAVRNRTEKKIKSALDGISNYEFKKKRSYACQWCECKGLCI